MVLFGSSQAVLASTIRWFWEGSPRGTIGQSPDDHATGRAEVEEIPDNCTGLGSSLLAIKQAVDVSSESNPGDDRD
jgi:hypothetical protein